MKRMILFLLMLAFHGFTFAQAGTCVKTASYCSQPNQTRTINGQEIYRSCWEFSDSYECYEAQSKDTCAPLRAISGCYELSNNCAERNFQGTCVRFNTIMRCNQSIEPSAEVTAIPPVYTVIVDLIQPSPECSALKAPDCVKTGRECVQGPSTKNINGSSVYKECWEWKDTYSCTKPNVVDYCKPLVEAGCSIASGPNCILSAPNGYCAQETSDYRCVGDGPLLPIPVNVSFVNKDIIINSENIETTCDKYKNANCVRTSGPVCVDGPSSKIINGQSIYRECWKWEEKYKCANPENIISDCDAIEANPKCTLKSGACLMRLTSGECAEYEKTYSCEIKPGITKQEEVCRNLVCDANGICIPAADQPDQDFGQTAAGMEIARQIGVYLDPKGINIFSGEDSRCSKGKLGIKSCCVPKGGGESNSALAGSMFEGLSSGAKEVADVGSMYMYDSLSSSETLQQGVGSMISGVNNWMNSAPDYDFFNGSFDPSFSYMGFTASYGAMPGASQAFTWATANIPGVGAAGTFINSGNMILAGGPPGFMIQFNPYILLAQLIIDWVLTCEPGDHVTALRRGQNLCHHVGTYCANKVLGACLEMRETHCCYNSRLGKIIQEQGRPQIGKSWGSPESPVCSGFTIAEMESLDFAKMDLSEFIKEIQAQAVNTVPGTNRATAAVASKVETYFGQGAGNIHKSPTGNSLTWSTAPKP